MATHSRILAWRIPWTEEPGGLQSMASHRVRHNWVTDSPEIPELPFPASFKDPRLEVKLRSASLIGNIQPFQVSQVAYHWSIFSSFQSFILSPLSFSLALRQFCCFGF